MVLQDGKLVVETDVVTGNYGTNDTPKGAYSIIYKASPANTYAEIPM